MTDPRDTSATGFRTRFLPAPRLAVWSPPCWSRRRSRSRDRLPDPLATHWGPSGRPDGSMSFAAFALVSGRAVGRRRGDRRRRRGARSHVGPPGAARLLLGRAGRAGRARARHAASTLPANLDAADWTRAAGLPLAGRRGGRRRADRARGAGLARRQPRPGRCPRRRRRRNRCRPQPGPAARSGSATATARGASLARARGARRRGGHRGLPARSGRSATAWSAVAASGPDVRGRRGAVVALASGSSADSAAVSVRPARLALAQDPARPCREGLGGGAVPGAGGRLGLPRPARRRHHHAARRRVPGRQLPLRRPAGRSASTTPSAAPPCSTPSSPGSTPP